MTREECAVFTEAAIKSGVIDFRHTASNDEKEIENVNQFNARQICNFFNALIDESENI
ncbi:MAG: hypothetical protein NC253_11340 [Ruminococcus sp.]|nr:hypothetical protein [Ruminococcus sp.]MCM1382144.1 hypothetical protein [Muribaculaceae bacterium]MCM1480827.1 hypothetical protein [Muribaculaceae bacterium]